MNIIDIDKHLTLFFNGSHSLFLDGLAISATSTYVWLVFYISLLYVIIRSGDMKFIITTIVAIAFCIVLADQGASGICKPLVQRFRPSQDPSLLTYIDIVGGYRGGMYGFFSSHAANTFALATFLSIIIRWCPLTLHLYAWALLNCWTRIYLGVHYFGDLLVGAAYGAFVGFVVAYAYKKILGSSPAYRLESPGIISKGGFAIYDVRFIIIALMTTYLYICFCAFSLA